MEMTSITELNPPESQDGASRCLKPTQEERLRIGVVIPKGVGKGYSGPTVFLKRLVRPLLDRSDVTIYAGVQEGHQPDPNFIPPARSMDIGGTRGADQLLWALRSAVWIVRDSAELDIVHFHGASFFNLLPALACLGQGIPYVLVPLASRSEVVETGKLSKLPFVRPLRRLIVRRAAGAFALGREIEEELTTLGLATERIHQIANPVTAGFFKSDTHQSDEDRALRVVFVGAMIERKRPELILEALAILRKEHGVTLYADFIGPFPSETHCDRFLELARTFGLSDHVTLVDYVEDVAPLLTSRRGIFVLPSKGEGLPGALTESMAAGFPSVVTDVGAMGDTVRAAGSGEVVAASATAIADSVWSMVADAEVWESYAQNARSYARENFHEDAVATKYLHRLEEFMAGRSGKGIKK
ncbi:glycosyltransferase [Citricoccus sp. NPDC079358]|uniref:glycosyltransferase family 4 protein n=1 Tax=Citricoccus sp. NPDC079358 TaxID=3154653 RepID=UPI00344DB87F